MFHTVHHSQLGQSIPKPDGGSKPTGLVSGLPLQKGIVNPSLDLLQGKLSAIRAEQIKDEFKRSVHAVAEAAKKESAQSKQ